MRSLRFWILALALLLAGPGLLSAQVGVTTDILSGRVFGPDGEPLAGAAVTATSIETGVRRTTLTNPQGRYTIIFPGGGGSYQLEATFLGMAPMRRTIARMADEEILIADLRMEVSPIAIEGIEVAATRGARPAQREPGTQERVLPGEALERLPIDPTSLEALATLAPGVVGLEGGDTLGLAFSVLGQGPGANQVALDGMSFGADGLGGFGLGIPQEAVRFTRVVTNTYDVARGQFSGGQIASTTRSGTNQVQGSFNYSLRDPALQWTMAESPFGGAFRQNRLSGGLGGPIIRDRLFYFGSVGLQRRSEGLQSLLSADPASLQRLGAHPDSVARLLSILAAQGIHAPELDGISGDRIGDAVTLLGRLDYNLTERHTLSLRGDARFFEQEGFRVGALGLPQTGGTMETSGSGAMLMLTSRFGGGWINELRAYVSGDRRETLPYVLMPTGRVRVTSELDDGTRSVSTLTFGGGSMEMASRSRNLEVSNELSLLLGTAHRIRIGGLFNSTRSTQELATNRLGSFTFNSLPDLEAGRPTSFTRSLAPQERESGGYSAALYVGDTWRPRQQLQLTYGVRLEGSAVAEQPAYNPQVEELFGRRTDRIPSEVRLSPRVGFSYTIGAREGAAPLGVLRGGFGEFRNRPPWSLFAGALDATGLPDAQAQLFCAGSFAPTPAWEDYLTAPGNIPVTCEGGEFLSPTAGRGTSVTVFDPGFGAARSWRASLGFQRRILQFMGVSVDATYAQGVSLTGVRDLNLDTSAQFELAQEGGRPVFVPPQAIVPGTGEVGFFGSRLHPEFGNVMEMHSELRSHTGQVTVGVNGFLPPLRMFFQTNYTYSRSIDQGASGGFGGFGGFRGFGGMGGGGGFGGASLPSTAANPNEPDWGTSDFERRHAVIATVGHQFRPWLDLTLIGRFTSGTPFTPLVGGDINGDGARNDRAFIFNPATAPDPAVAEGMARVLATAPAQVRSCLEPQLGTIAERNSCRGPWNQSFDLRANFRPELPGIGRRLTISVDAVNTLTGLDRLLHGSENLRGWGQQSRPDPILLYPRGFDAATQSFRYEVNERFGASRQGALALRNPFAIQIQAQMRVGPQRGQMGMMGPGMRGRGPGGPGGGAGPGGFDLRTMLERGMPNPVARILELRDTLALSDEQVAALQPIADSLQARQEAITEAVERQMQAQRGEPMERFRQLQPQLREARAARDEALAAARQVLTPEQWERVPEEIRNPPREGEMRGGRRPQE